jgi:hypothetical protein
MAEVRESPSVGERRDSPHAVRERRDVLAAFDDS